MANPDWNSGKPAWKPKRGAAILARAADDAARKKKEHEVAAQVKARDGHKCRWPEAHVCRGGPLEAAHIRDKSLRGPTVMENEITLCPFLHRRGPESIHSKDLKIEPETAFGTNGPVSFWRRTDEVDALGQPVYYMVARERSVGVIERD
jgi:hypothetical protein